MAPDGRHAPSAVLDRKSSPAPPAGRCAHAHGSPMRHSCPARIPYANVKIGRRFANVQADASDGVGPVAERIRKDCARSSSLVQIQAGPPILPASPRAGSRNPHASRWFSQGRETPRCGERTPVHHRQRPRSSGTAAPPERGSTVRDDRACWDKPGNDRGRASEGAVDCGPWAGFQRMKLISAAVIPTIAATIGSQNSMI